MSRSSSRWRTTSSVSLADGICRSSSARCPGRSRMPGCARRRCRRGRRRRLPIARRRHVGIACGSDPGRGGVRATRVDRATGGRPLLQRARLRGVWNITRYIRPVRGPEKALWRSFGTSHVPSGGRTGLQRSLVTRHVPDAVEGAQRPFRAPLPGWWPRPCRRILQALAPDFGAAEVAARRGRVDR